jgi:hypothetical protein
LVAQPKGITQQYSLLIRLSDRMNLDLPQLRFQ